MSVARPAGSLVSRRLVTTAAAAAASSSTATGGNSTAWTPSRPTAATTTKSNTRAMPSSRAPSCPRQHPRSHFHTTPRLPSARKHKPRFKNVLKDADTFTKQHFQPYTPEEIATLRKHYSAAQMDAVEAGESAIDPRDLAIQGRIRTDVYRMPYLDDFSHYAPVIDKRRKKLPPPSQRRDKEVWLEDEDTAMESMYPQNPRVEKVRQAYYKQELKSKADDIAKFERLAHHKQLEKLQKFWPRMEEEYTPFQVNSMLKDDNEKTNSALAPGLGSDIPGVSGRYENAADAEDQGLDDEGMYQDLKRRTGLSVRDMMNLTVKILVTRMVHNQTRLGKIRSIWIMAIAGNGNGRLGIGVAKSVENGSAVLKARLMAIRNMQPVRRYEDRTIYGSVQAKVGATIVKLDARPPGFGVRASARMFEMFRAVGIHDIAAKMPRSRNPMNSVKACFKALTTQLDPEELAVGRGRKLVDVRKVYYGGNVY